METIELHGQPVRYHRVGAGPLLVLVHGITSSSRTWERVLPLLARDHTVIAPDLLGHGRSAKPRGDYSLGAHASGLRDLLVALGEPPATVVGHSLGGGIAMQLAYQYPERVERLVLVGSGGLGAEVHVILRAATLPGAEHVVPLLLRRELRRPVEVLAGGLRRLGWRPGSDLQGMAEGLASLADDDARRAFVHTARSILDFSGQRVSAEDRLYLAEGMPTLIVWGARDPMIPAEHGRRAHEAMPGSRLAIFEEAGHFPFNDDPVRFADVLASFVAETAPARVGEQRMRELLLRRRAA
jgi:pimeloyl-ACP methyl ester carboxylesterase